MCGINGYYLKNINNLEKINLNSANKKLSHRGPDNVGVFYSKDKKCGLGHTRLSIQDTSVKANQPMISSCKRFIIVFNGEIYNLKELKKYLSKNSSDNFYLTKSDTELILKLFAFWVKENRSFSDFLLKLNGIFSLAIWDNHNQELFLARDSFGVKPLYFSNGVKGFFFSSELKSLPSMGVEIKDIDPVSINHYLTYIWCPGNGTPIKNIKKVYPGEYLIIKDGLIKKQIKWQKNFYQQKKNVIKDKKECIENTRILLRKAVHRQLISDVPLGCFLSGGLDSSSIVTFAKELIPDIKCFTIRTKESLQEDGFIDDFKFAQKVSSHLNVDLESIEVSSDMLVQNIENMVYTMDAPIADPASINVKLISKLAKQSGIKVLLSGTGGDDLFTGYRRHQALSNEVFWSFLPRSIREKISESTSILNTKRSLERRIKKVFSGANLSPDKRIINYFRWNKPEDLKNLYSPDFLEILNQNDTYDPLEYYLNGISKDWSRLDQMLFLEQRFFLTDHNLLYTDKMSMSESVEVRVPFLDNKLVEFASRIPIKYKNNRGNLKWVLKKAMEPYLPSEIIYRSKTGFGVPLRKWVRVELREWINDILSYDSIKKRGLFNAVEVLKLIENNNKNKIDAGYTILSLACIEIWCRKFLN